MHVLEQNCGQRIYIVSDTHLLANLSKWKLNLGWNVCGIPVSTPLNKPFLKTHPPPVHDPPNMSLGVHSDREDLSKDLSEELSTKMKLR